jgi:hypothetical protein
MQVDHHEMISRDLSTISAILNSMPGRYGVRVSAEVRRLAGAVSEVMEGDLCHVSVFTHTGRCLLIANLTIDAESDLPVTAACIPLSVGKMQMDLMRSDMRTDLEIPTPASTYPISVLLPVWRVMHRLISCISWIKFVAPRNRS